MKIYLSAALTAGRNWDPLLAHTHTEVLISFFYKPRGDNICL